MKKIVLLMSFLFLCSYPCVAFDSDAYSNIVKDRQMYNADNPKVQKNSSDTEGSDDFYNELINEDYGCDMSPAFLNRENMNPNEADYGYGGSDGM